MASQKILVGYLAFALGNDLKNCKRTRFEVCFGDFDAQGFTSSVGEKVGARPIFKGKKAQIGFIGVGREIEEPVFLGNFFCRRLLSRRLALRE